MTVSIIICGSLTVEIGLIFGAFSVCIFLFCRKFLGYNLHNEIILIRLLPTIVQYVFCLFRNVLISDIGLLKIIYSRNNATYPYLIIFRSGIKSDFLNMILANSISITPGTITVDMTDDEFTVHCIHKSFAEGIEKSEFIKLLKKMEEKYEY